MCLCYLIWFRWLHCSLIISYHACACVCSVISCFLVIIIVHFLWKNPDLTCNCQWVEWQDLYPYRTIWIGNWFYLMLQGLLSSCWTNATPLHFCASSLDGEKLLQLFKMGMLPILFYAIAFWIPRRTKVLS